MGILLKIYYAIHDNLFGLLKHLDGLALLAIRLFLAPIMIAAGMTKWRNFDSTVQWFGNAEWGLGLPAPELMAGLATGTELFGGFLLLFGLAVRWVSIPLMVTMFVAATEVHLENGWFAIAPSDPTTSSAKLLADVGIPAAEDSLKNSLEVGARLERAKDILREHGNYDWLTEKGSFVILNNGIEFATTYFIMLMVLFFWGGGRYLSLDYYFDRSARKALADLGPPQRDLDDLNVPD
ncbi:DoxX family protein [Litorivivens sp.]|jgi:putative oxidoreductase|uniref:HvfX family Cu-binding RiPP maturation protein n=1 Tax=Litorivivens sp. TaxID=2020868 RepID=UPI003562935A